MIRLPRKKILIVIESLARGGAERLLVTTLAHLSRDRFDVEVASLFGPGPLAEEVRALGIPVHELALSGPRDLLRAVKGLRRLVREGRYDVVHTHLFSANIAGRIAAGRTCPVLTTLHNPDYGQEGPQNGVGARRLLDGTTALLFKPKMLAVSEDVRGDYRRHLCLDDVEVLYNYMDVAGFCAEVEQRDRTAERRRLGLGQDGFVVLHAGRLHRQKGQDVLLEAFAEVRDAVPGSTLLVAGEGPDGDALRDRARRLDLESTVRFMGSVADVAGLYACADAFAFPSRYEAFGVALLEAMAVGLPSVVSRVGGLVEVATPQTSVFVEPEDVSGLAEALASLGKDRALRRRLGDGARLRAREFDVGVWLPRLEAIYGAA